MDKKTKIIILTASSFLLVGGIVAFLVARKNKRNLKKEEIITTEDDILESDYSSDYAEYNETDVTPSSNYQKYKVVTSTSNLNVRQSPSTSSSVLMTLAKGSTIFAKPSSTSGWHIYSKDGVSQTGFVSSEFISKI
jgi:hypothetical protein